MMNDQQPADQVEPAPGRDRERVSAEGRQGQEAWRKSRKTRPEGDGGETRTVPESGRYPGLKSPGNFANVDSMRYQQPRIHHPPDPRRGPDFGRPEGLPGPPGN